MTLVSGLGALPDDCPPPNPDCLNDEDVPLSFAYWIFRRKNDYVILDFGKG